MLRSSKTIPRDNEFIFELIKEYDEYGYMSEELGRELDSLFEDKNYVIGIHRTGYTSMNEETINNIFNNGLINNGHIMQGSMTSNLDIERTVSLFNDFPLLNAQLKASPKYKDSEGCFIIKIPKSYLGRNDGPIEPIYYKNDGVIKLLPEFIYGYIPVEKGGKLGEINRNPKYKNMHNLNNPHLLYEGDAIDKANKEGIKLDKDNVSFSDKYEIISKAFKDTILKYGSYQAEQALFHLLKDNEVQYFTGEYNRYLLSKYVIYGDTLSVIAIMHPELSNKNDIIQSFISECNNLEIENRIK